MDSDAHGALERQWTNFWGMVYLTYTDYDGVVHVHIFYMVKACGIKWDTGTRHMSMCIVSSQHAQTVSDFTLFERRKERRLTIRDSERVEIVDYILLIFIYDSQGCWRCCWKLMWRMDSYNIGDMVTKGFSLQYCIAILYYQSNK